MLLNGFCKAVLSSLYFKCSNQAYCSSSMTLNTSPLRRSIIYAGSEFCLESNNYKVFLLVAKTQPNLASKYLRLDVLFSSSLLCRPTSIFLYLGCGELLYPGTGLLLWRALKYGMTSVRQSWVRFVRGSHLHLFIKDIPFHGPVNGRAPPVTFRIA